MFVVVVNDLGSERD